MLRTDTIQVTPSIQHLLTAGRLPVIEAGLRGRRLEGNGDLRCGSSRFRVFAFETRRLGESRECPPRTVGFAALLSGNQTGLGTVGTKEAVSLSLRLGSEAASTESAKEKVIFCSRRG